MRSYAYKIKEVRKNAGFSQDEFAEKIGVSRQTVYKWEQDIIRPTPKNLKKICEVFNVSAEYFFEVKIQGEQAQQGKVSVFYEENEAIKIWGLIIALFAELFVLGWSAFNLILRLVKAQQGSTIFDKNAMLNDYLYFGLIIAALCAALIVTVLGLVKIIKKEKKKV